MNRTPGKDDFDLQQISYYRSLRRRMVLIVLLVSFTPMLLISGLILFQFKISYHEKVEDHLQELVQKHKQNIDAFLSERLSDIRFLATAFNFEQLSNEHFLQEKLTEVRRNFGPVFEDLGVITDAGLQVAYAGPYPLGRALYADADWFKKAIQSEFYISDVFLGLRGLPHFIVAVRQTWQGRPWILRATIDFMAFNSLVENLRIGKTGFAFIMNREGEFQTKHRVDVIPDKSAFRYFVDDDAAENGQVLIVQQKDPQGIRNIYAAAFLKNGEWVMVCQQKTQDAFSDLRRTLWIALVLLVLGCLTIAFTATLLSGRMVNRIRKADREKEMMNQQVIETGKLASIGELAAGIAHEINNPVAIMFEEAGWMQDLLEEEDIQGSKNLEEFSKSLNQIKTQGRRCKEITHKLLSFARKTDSRIQDVKLNELIDEVVSLSSQRAKYGNVTIQKHLQEDTPPVPASPTEMQQVFLNLINNALDAMETKGGIIDITTRLNEGFVEIEVADNGPGIAKQNIERLFDPFFTTKPVGKGTGLGLSICYGIINKMGGTIDVRSVVDLGTTFCVRVPTKKSD